MKMNKKLVSVIIVFAIALMLFVVLTTAIPFTKCASSWVSFAFGIVAIISSCVITIYAFSKGNDFKSKLYGFPVFKVGIMYLVAQMIVCIIMFIVGAFVDVPLWISLIIGVMLLGLCMVGVLLTDNARDVIEELDKKGTEQIRQMKTFTVNVTSVKAMCRNDEQNKALETLEEDFRFSDPVSSQATEEIESLIKSEIGNLTELVAQNNTEAVIDKVKEIKGMLASRNAICKLNKA